MIQDQVVFDTHGNLKQKEAALAWQDDSVTDLLYGGGKGGGKTYLGVNLIFGDALTYDGTHHFIARKELNDLRRFTIPSIHEVFQHWNLEPNKYLKWHGQDNYFQLPNDSKVFLLSAKHLPQDPMFERFGSMQMTRGWIEEAGEFHPSAKSNLQASIGRWKNDVYGLVPKLLQTCNPSKNYLYLDYYKPFKAGTLDSWKRFIQALPTDNKRLPKGYIENLERTLSKNERRRLLLGEWEYEDDPTALMNYEDIISIFSNIHVLGIGKMCMTVDVARFGKDKTIVRVWDGWRVVKLDLMEGKNTREVADRVKALAIDFKVPLTQVVIDEDGIGGGVVDNFPKNSVKGFIANSRPINPKTGENYENLKAQCAYIVADKVKKREVYEEITDLVQREFLIEDLEQVREKNVDKSKRGLVSKDEIKKILQRSPDHGDTYIMRGLLEVVRTGGLRII